MVTIIAEKPAVAEAIARFLKIDQRQDGYIYGNGYAVTWAYGHMLELHVPESDRPWNETPLPLLPKKFNLRIIQKEKKDDPKYAFQLNVIKYLFDNSEYIINSTDAAREGELIFREIYEYTGSTKPVYRLWMSSLTDEAIGDAFATMLPASDYDNLYQSARCRNEADWLVGINATRAISLASGQEYNPMNLGRVQTPVLAMICERYIDNIHFQPVTYYVNTVRLSKDNILFAATNGTRFSSYNEAAAAKAASEAPTALVTKITKKERREEAPKLHNITSIQKEADIRFGYNATYTTEILESLYLKAYISYPRTNSRYITEDVFKTVPGIFERMKGTPFSQFINSWPEPLSRRPIDPTKIEDHHALIVTGKTPSNIESQAEFNIYCLIAYRMVEAFGQEAVYETVTAQLLCGETKYEVRGRKLLSPGWTDILARRDKDENSDEQEDEDELAKQKLPQLEEGDSVKIVSVDLLKKQTKPRPLLTIASLLTMMEKASSLTQDEDMKKALKRCDGIGTGATRGETIEGLIRKKQIVKNGNRSLEPTDRGLLIYSAVRDKEVASVELTAKWETDLEEIASGNAPSGPFEEEIREFTTDIVRQLSSSSFSQMLKKALDSQKSRCPQCGNPVEIGKYTAKCPACHLSIFRKQYGKDLTDEQLRQIIDKGRTKNPVKGLISKSGKRFEAVIALTDDFKTKLIFEQ